MSTNISQHGAASIKIKARGSIVGDTGRFQTIDITITGVAGAPLLEIICFSVDDIPTTVELDINGARSGCTIPAANPPTPDKEEAV